MKFRLTASSIPRYGEDDYEVLIGLGFTYDEEGYCDNHREYDDKEPTVTFNTIEELKDWCIKYKFFEIVINFQDMILEIYNDYRE